MKQMIKKYGVLCLIALSNLLMLLICPPIGKEALYFSTTAFLRFLVVLTPVFICVGLMDVWVEREKMMRIMGADSGGKGMLAAFLCGMATAVPFYALLPIAGVFLKKGCRILNVLLFLCASTSVRVPLLLFEVSSLGVRFALIRFGLNLPIVFGIAHLIEKCLSDADKKEIYEMAEKR